MSTYGCYVKFTTLPGQRDILVKHLLHASTLVGKDRRTAHWRKGFTPA